MAAGLKFLPIFAAASSLLPAQIWAAPATHSGIGATSRASIAIEASVAPRMGVQRLPAGALGSASGRPGLACIWSSLPIRSYTFTLQPSFGEPSKQVKKRENGPDREPAWARGSEIAPLIPEPAAERVAYSSAAACTHMISQAGGLTVQAIDGSQGSVLLILAPQ